MENTFKLYCPICEKHFDYPLKDLKAGTKYLPCHHFINLDENDVKDILDRLGKDNLPQA